MSPRIGLLDRYVLTTWLRIFVVTALGFPVVAIVINMVDKLSKLLDRGLTWGDILLSYVYSVPENMFLVMPAAVLFATVFTINGMSRYSEITAAKAGGRSFHRIFLPVFVGAVGVAGLAFAVGELAVRTSARHNELQENDRGRDGSVKYNFVYRGDEGWVYTIRSLDSEARRLDQLLLERQGTGTEYPALVITADSATYDDTLPGWWLWNGASRTIAGRVRQATFQFDRMRLADLTQTPVELLAEPRAPEEMRYAELGRYIEALKRSGNDASKLEVERALKLAVPVTCLIIALFGAPLAMTAPRAGAAAGIAVSLGTTVTFLLLAQIAKAVGSGGVVDPVLAAWTPNAVFLLAALWLMWRVRT